MKFINNCKDEIAHLQAWAAANNLRLNREKTKEIIFSARRKGVLPGIERVPSLRVLGVIVNCTLTAADHVTTLLSSGTSLLYAMRVLRSHGTPLSSLHDIFRATVVSRIQYAAPAWSTGRACAWRRTARVLTRCCAAANGSVTVAMTCLSSPTCSTLPTMTFPIASKPTLTTFSNLIFLTRLTTLRISSVIALTTLH